MSRWSAADRAQECLDSNSKISESKLRQIMWELLKEAKEDRAAWEWLEEHWRHKLMSAPDALGIRWSVCSFGPSGAWLSENEPTPRDAVLAAMEAERQRVGGPPVPDQDDEEGGV